MNKCLLLLILAVPVEGLLAQVATPDFVRTHGQLSVQGTQWSIADKNETCSVLVPGAKATGGWPITDLKPSGVHTRKLLHELNR